MPFRVCGLIGMVFACTVYVTLSSCGKQEAINAKKNVELKNSTNGKIIIDNVDKKNEDEKEKKSNSNKNKESTTVRPSEAMNITAEDTISFKKSKELNKSRVLFNSLFSLNLWLIMLVGGLNTFVLKSMADWTGLFLIESSELSIQISTELMLWNEIGGMTGTLLCGILSDLLGGKKYLTSFIFVCICIIAIAYFPKNLKSVKNTENLSWGEENFFLDNFQSLISIQSIVINCKILLELIVSIFKGQLGLARFCLFSMGLGINGPKTLLGVMVRDLVPREISGTIGGLFGLISQIGASAAGAGKQHKKNEK